tara:strand:+ start:360 stop:563 length:204 start_codon:yes stop_codon:yes gene_type:complete
MDNTESIDRNKKLLAIVFKEIENMGHVVVGKQSYIESISGLICIHPINIGHLINEISARLTAAEETN